MISDDKPQQDPAEGSREVIDHQLAQQEGKHKPHSTPAPAETEEERRSQMEPAEGSRETADRNLARGTQN